MPATAGSSYRPVSTTAVSSSQMPESSAVSSSAATEGDDYSPPDFSDQFLASGPDTELEQREAAVYDLTAATRLPSAARGNRYLL